MKQNLYGETSSKGGGITVDTNVVFIKKYSVERQILLRAKGIVDAGADVSKPEELGILFIVECLDSDVHYSFVTRELKGSYRGACIHLF